MASLTRTWHCCSASLAELRRDHPAAVLETGCGDEGDPWANIEADEGEDVVISATRVDGKWMWMDAQGCRWSPHWSRRRAYRPRSPRRCYTSRPHRAPVEHS
jgi:hypothetical protein